MEAPSQSRKTYPQQFAKADYFRYAVIDKLRLYAPYRPGVLRGLDLVFHTFLEIQERSNVIYQWSFFYTCWAEMLLEVLGYTRHPKTPDDPLILATRAHGSALYGHMLETWRQEHPERWQWLWRSASWVPRWTPAWHRRFNPEFRERVRLLLLARLDHGSVFHALPMEACWRVIERLAWIDAWLVR